MKANRVVQKWIFFSEDTEGRRHIFNVRECKSPSRTADWQELQLHLGKDHIQSVGYEVEKEISLSSFGKRLGIDVIDLTPTPFGYSVRTGGLSNTGTKLNK